MPQKKSPLPPTNLLTLSDTFKKNSNWTGRNSHQYTFWSANNDTIDYNSPISLDDFFLYLSKQSMESIPAALHLHSTQINTLKPNTIFKLNQRYLFRAQNAYSTQDIAHAFDTIHYLIDKVPQSFFEYSNNSAPFFQQYLHCIEIISQTPPNKILKKDIQPVLPTIEPSSFYNYLTDLFTQKQWEKSELYSFLEHYITCLNPSNHFSIAKNSLHTNIFYPQQFNFFKSIITHYNTIPAAPQAESSNNTDSEQSKSIVQTIDLFDLLTSSTPLNKQPLLFFITDPMLLQEVCDILYTQKERFNNTSFLVANVSSYSDFLMSHLQKNSAQLLSTFQNHPLTHYLQSFDSTTAQTSDLTANLRKEQFILICSQTTDTTATNFKKLLQSFEFDPFKLSDEQIFLSFYFAIMHENKSILKFLIQQYPNPPLTLTHNILINGETKPFAITFVDLLAKYYKDATDSQKKLLEPLLNYCNQSYINTAFDQNTNHLLNFSSAPQQALLYHVSTSLALRDYLSQHYLSNLSEAKRSDMLNTCFPHHGQGFSSSYYASNHYAFISQLLRSPQAKQSPQFALNFTKTHLLQCLTNHSSINYFFDIDNQYTNQFFHTLKAYINEHDLTENKNHYMDDLDTLPYVIDFLKTQNQNLTQTQLDCIKSLIEYCQPPLPAKKNYSSWNSIHHKRLNNLPTLLLLTTQAPELLISYFQYLHFFNITEKKIDAHAFSQQAIPLMLDALYPQKASLYKKQLTDFVIKSTRPIIDTQKNYQINKNTLCDKTKSTYSSEYDLPVQKTHPFFHTQPFYLNPKLSYKHNEFKLYYHEPTFNTPIQNTVIAQHALGVDYYTGYNNYLNHDYQEKIHQFFTELNSTIDLNHYQDPNTISSQDIENIRPKIEQLFNHDQNHTLISYERFVQERVKLNFLKDSTLAFRLESISANPQLSDDVKYNLCDTFVDHLLNFINPEEKKNLFFESDRQMNPALLNECLRYKSAFVLFSILLNDLNIINNTQLSHLTQNISFAKKINQLFEYFLPIATSALNEIKESNIFPYTPSEIFMNQFIKNPDTFSALQSSFQLLQLHNAVPENDQLASRKPILKL